MVADAQPWRASKECVIVRIRLTPKSSLEAIDGVTTTAEGPAFTARVRAVPAEGEANAALERLVAKWLDVPKSAVRVTQGAKSRVKSLTVGGKADYLERQLSAKLMRDE